MTDPTTDLPVDVSGSGCSHCPPPRLVTPRSPRLDSVIRPRHPPRPKGKVPLPSDVEPQSETGSGHTPDDGRSSCSTSLSTKWRSCSTSSFSHRKSGTSSFMWDVGSRTPDEGWDQGEDRRDRERGSQGKEGRVLHRESSKLSSRQGDRKGLL